MLEKSVFIHSKSFLMLTGLLIFAQSTLVANFQNIVKFVQCPFKFSNNDINKFIVMSTWMTENNLMNYNCLKKKNSLAISI